MMGYALIRRAAPMNGLLFAASKAGVWNSIWTPHGLPLLASKWTVVPAFKRADGSIKIIG